MGWFEEQLKQRKEADERMFREAFYSISDSVTGEKISKFLQSDIDRSGGAIGDIIAFYGGKASGNLQKSENIDDELDFMCRLSGIMRRNVVLEKNWYKNAIGAYLAWDSRNEKITALLPDRISGKYKYFDDELCRDVKIGSREEAYFEGEAICFYKPLPLRKITASDLFKYAVSLWTFKDVLLPFITVAAVMLLGLVGPALNHFLFNEVYITHSYGFLISSILFLVCLSVSRKLLDAVHLLLIKVNDTKSSVSVQAAMMMRVLSLPAGFFKNYSSGEIMQRMNCADGLCSSFTHIVFGAGISSLLSLVYIIQMIRYAKSLVIPALGVIALAVIYLLIAAYFNVKANKAIMEAETKESGVSYSLINGVQKIKLAGAEKRAFSRWAELYAKVSEAKYQFMPVVKLKNVAVSAISFIGEILIFSAAVQSNINVADYYAFDTAYALVFSAFVSLVQIVDDISNFRPALDMIHPILDAEPEAAVGKQLVTRLSGGIELDNISFRYSDNMPLIFDNLSLKIRPGQYVAIVGKTGCGKSTLVRLLLGFEKPRKGAVYYDGRDLDSLDLKSLRHNIGTVMQEGKLFQGDIYSNIVISAPWLTLDDAWDAAEMAGMAEDIEAMPMGMHTLISEGSGGISGGQRQRLMIARAIASHPKILIFDEATSALDNITQKIVSDSLDSLSCTRIVVAHRLSTIKNCDRILFLDNGRIAEEGSYEELIAKNGAFADLVKRQILDEEQ